MMLRLAKVHANLTIAQGQPDSFLRRHLEGCDNLGA